MTATLEHSTATRRGQPRPGPLTRPTTPPLVLPPHLIWARLPPLVQAQVQATFILVAREVLHAADHP